MCIILVKKPKFLKTFEHFLMKQNCLKQLITYHTVLSHNYCATNLLIKTHFL